MLIVDDETVQLRLMHQIIAALKPDYLIDTASRAQSALHLMETSAYDVVLTDIRMPGMDGLEMIRVAKERELGTELFIILSGFDDFKYAQQAIRYQVSDYLLKPIHEKSLLDVFNHVEQKVHLKRQAQQADFGEKRLRVREALCKRLLGLSLSEREQYIISNWLAEDQKICLLCCAVGDTALTERLETAIPSSIALTMQAQQACLAIPLFANDGLEGTRRRAQAALAAEDARYTLSEAYPLSRIDEAYQQCVSLMENVRFLDAGGLCARDAGPKWPGMQAGGETLEERLVAARDALAAGTVSANAVREEAARALERRVEEAKEAFQNTALTQKLVQEGRTELLACERFADLRRCLAQRLAQVEAARHAQDAFALGCRDYIERNFSQDLSLTGIAESFCYNPSYFSLRFSQTFGVPFSKYLSRYRIDRACELLTGTEESAASISRAVGMADPTYFNKVFKETTGMTPKRYRQFHTR